MLLTAPSHRVVMKAWTQRFEKCEYVSTYFVCWHDNVCLVWLLWQSSDGLITFLSTGIRSGVSQTSTCWDSWPTETGCVWRGWWVTCCSSRSRLVHSDETLKLSYRVFFLFPDWDGRLLQMPHLQETLKKPKCKKKKSLFSYTHSSFVC